MPGERCGLLLTLTLPAESPDQVPVQPVSKNSLQPAAVREVISASIASSSIILAMTTLSENETSSRYLECGSPNRCPNFYSKREGIIYAHAQLTTAEVKSAFS